MKEACLFDIDGVLFDVSIRYNRALENDPSRKEIFWKTFFSEDLLILDKPLEIGINNLMRCIDKGYEVIILSGRPERLREATIEQLRRINIFENKHYKKLILRRDNDVRKSYVFKIEVVEKLIREFVLREVHDDDIEFLRRVSSIIPEATLYYYENNEAKVLGLGRLDKYLVAKK